MTPLQKLSIHHQIERLIYDFLARLEGSQASVADFFAEDGEAFGYIGRAKIRAHFAGIESADNNVNVNLCENLIIDVVDENRAFATNYLVHYESGPSAVEISDPFGSRVGGELKVPRSITRWTWEFGWFDTNWLVTKLGSPSPTLLRKDVIDELKRGKYR